MLIDLRDERAMMAIDIPLAGWVLSLLAFVLGTITPFIYRRFFYEGLSVQPVLGVRAITQDNSQKTQDEVVFSTVVKFANAGTGTVLLDGAEVSPLAVDEFEFKPIGFELKLYEPKTEIHLPPSTTPDHLIDYLPLLIKSSEERMMAIGFKLKCSPCASLRAMQRLGDHIENNGLKVAFRINGKYRKYVIRVRRPTE
jgi:hypothetical protein